MVIVIGRLTFLLKHVLFCRIDLSQKLRVAEVELVVFLARPNVSLGSQRWSDGGASAVVWKLLQASVFLAFRAYALEPAGSWSESGGAGSTLDWANWSLFRWLWRKQVCHLGCFMLLFDQVELLFESFNLLSVLPQQGVLGVFVNLWLIFNALGSVCISQSWQSFLVAGRRWRNVRNHASFYVAT